MSTPPGRPSDEGTVTHPNVMPRAPVDEATVLVPPSRSGDPHAPTLRADAIAAGPAPDGNALPVGTYLGEFELTTVIGEGGFGIVYLAMDHSLQRRIALKEYMPSSLAERTSGMQVSSLSDDDEETFRKGLDSFINEARMLAQFDHPSLVKVHRFWEANGTAYMVMPFYEGPTLKQVLRDLPAPPDEAWLRGLLEPLTEVLAVIHGQQCYHRDIAPDNILLLAGSGRPLLLDFGAARRVIGDANQALTVILKPGYAPIEQYAEVPGMKQGPWTDVYALAAVVYFAILGKKPPAAVGRLLNDQYQPLVQQAAGRYSEAFLRAIDAALVVKPAERTQNIDAFRAALGFAPLARESSGALSNTNGVPASPDPTRIPSLTGQGTVAAAPAPAAASARRSPAPWLGLGAAGVLLAAGAWWWVAARQPAMPALPAAAPAAAPPVAVAPPPPAASAVAAQAAAVSPAAAALPFTVPNEFRRIVQAQTPGFTVEAQPAKPAFRVEKDLVKLNFQSVRDGYYYVLSYSPDGELFQLFPNARSQANTVTAGRSLEIPPPSNDKRDQLHAVEPPGQAKVLIIVSRYRRDFSLLGNQRIEQFHVLPTGKKAEDLAATQGGTVSIYAGRPVCPAGEACTDEYGAALIELEIVR
jgi:serine/threonine protein kinase